MSRVDGSSSSAKCCTVRDDFVAKDVERELLKLKMFEMDAV
jgi:hypothetical protein